MQTETVRNMLSIIIPTKNRACYLDNALEGIVKQNKVQGEYEVIVIDNGSTDATKKVADKYKGAITNFRYIYDSRPGLHVGRNRGIMESKGEYIAFIDDDEILFPNYINAVLEAYKDEKLMVVCGSAVPYDMSVVSEDFRKKHVIKRGNFNFAYPISCYWEEGISENDTRVHPAKPGMFFGGCTVYKKEILIACQGFHPDSMPKELLMYRGDGECYVEKYIVERKLKAMYCAQASIWHQIDVDRVTPEYLRYMFFRNGISHMYTGLRENGVKGGAHVLLNCLKSNILKEGIFHKLRGEIYLFLYYIFYDRVRKWVHKKNYF